MTERRVSLADMKSAWAENTIPESPEEPVSAAAGTLAGMQRPLKPAVLQRSETLTKIHGVAKSSSHDSSSTESTYEDSGSDSDNENAGTPAMQSPVGAAPPPPLRNIPHQTLETSPTTSLLFSRNNQLKVPEQRHSVPNIGNRISNPGGIARQSLPVDFRSSRPVMVMPPNSQPSFSALGRYQPSRDNVIDVKLNLADQRTSPSTRVIISAPVCTSTPKPKRLRFPDAEEARHADVGGRHQIAVQSEPELRRDNRDGQGSLAVPQGAIINTSKVETNLASTASAWVAPTEDSAVQSLPEHKQPRAPSQLLQRNMSNEMISSQSSVSVDSSLSESEQRDKFDPNGLTMRSLPTLAKGGTVGQPLLPALSTGAAPTSPLAPLSRLPAIVRGAQTPPPPSPLQQSNSLPSYQEVKGMSRMARPTSAHLTPPNYYSGGRGGGGGPQDNSSHPIHQNAMEGVSSSEMKSLALQFGVDYRDSGGRTPLMYAVLGNQPKMCEVLVKLKADLNARDMAGLTPLLWATYQAKAAIIRVLLKNGANPRHADQDGRTVFHWAMKTPNIHCLKWLCKYACAPELVNQQDCGNLTALHWGVMTDQAAHVKMFLQQMKADISVQDAEGRSALNYAVLNFSPSCIRAILDHNEAAVSLTDAKGRTALHYACAEGSADCVRTLLSYRKSNIHCVDNNGTTPLHWAAAANQPGLIQLLLRRGADRGQLDNSGRTPLDCAEQKGHDECVRILRYYGLRRPGSASSLASHASVNMTAGPSNLDEHGHVIIREYQRQLSMSGLSAVSSIDRLPADGRAQSESPADREGAGEREQQDVEGETGENKKEGVEGAEPMGGVGGAEPRGGLDPGKGAPEQTANLDPEQGGSEARQENKSVEIEGPMRNENVQIFTTRNESNHDSIQQQSSHSERSRWRKLLCCCNCCVKRTSAVTPLL